MATGANSATTLHHIFLFTVAKFFSTKNYTISSRWKCHYFDVTSYFLYPCGGGIGVSLSAFRDAVIPLLAVFYDRFSNILNTLTCIADWLFFLE